MSGPGRAFSRIRRRQIIYSGSKRDDEADPKSGDRAGASAREIFLVHMTRSDSRTLAHRARLYEGMDPRGRLPVFFSLSLSTVAGALSRVPISCLKSLRSRMPLDCGPTPDQCLSVSHAAARRARKTKKKKNKKKKKKKKKKQSLAIDQRDAQRPRESMTE